MKNSYIILFLLFFISSCNDQKLTYKEAVITYYNAFDSGDFNEMKTVLSDSITIIGGDYVMPFNQDSFYEHFKWDSIFKTSYKLLEIEEKNNQVYATVASKSIKNEFLKRVKEQMEELLASAEFDANDIGGSFRSPGIMAEIRKELEKQVKKFR